MVTPRQAEWLDKVQMREARTRQADVLALVQASDYAARQLLKVPAYFSLIAADQDWAGFDFAGYVAEVGNVDSESALLRALRVKKHGLQTALIHAVVTQKLDQPGFLKAISQLAAALVDVALDWQTRALVARLGQPLDEQGKPLQMVVLAMGKFGGQELNFSSDIDLIFAYRNGGETVAEQGGQSRDHEVFFRKLAQKLIYSLDQVTEDGFVYRVDMRLRPFGQTGPLALTFDALETYYQTHGRDWERYAMMKARPVAGDIAGGYRLLGSLRPFMYRRYLDYSALKSIAEMKQSINRQIREQGMEKHIKLGRGGIREAEFSVQAMQLVYGGQYPVLQSPHFLEVLEQLSELKLFSPKQSRQLREAYLVLRTVENALQFDQEQQTHQLPEAQSDWQRLADASGFADITQLQKAVARAREIIHRQFRGIFDESVEESETAHEVLFATLNWAEPSPEKLVQGLKKSGLSGECSETMTAQLLQFARSMPWQRLPAKTVERLERLLPQLIDTAIREQADAQALAAILELVREVSGRSVYVEMLYEQPRLRSHLLAIARDSAWLIDFIRAHPLVLDDVLSEREHVDDPAHLETDLAARLEGLDEEDWLNALRDFKHAQLFKVAWADVHGNMPLMRVSDNLSRIAELVLKYAYKKAYGNLVVKHGEPRCEDGSTATFAIIGYGKLGGLELGYGSDLDIVFIYSDQRSQGMTDGDKPIANQLFFTRLVQRIVNYLSASSTSGVLYEVDTRLRPGGKSGMLTASLEAFREYQENSAWVWEHQALSRARSVVGDEALCAKFETLRSEILRSAPSVDLREEVLSMRQKMLANANLPKDDQFHLKQSPGGMIDIEFMVQYLLLKHAHDEPVLVRMSDNIRQLAALEATGILASSEAMTLRDAYRQMREQAHHCFLNNQDNVVDAEPWRYYRSRIQRIWKTVFALDATEELTNDNGERK